MTLNSNRRAQPRPAHTLVALACALAANVASAGSALIPDRPADANTTQYTFAPKGTALINDNFNNVAASSVFVWNTPAGANQWSYVSGRSSPVTWPIPNIATPPWPVSTGDTAACFNTGTKGTGSVTYLELNKYMSGLAENHRYRVTATVGTRLGAAASFLLMLGDPTVPSGVRTIDIPAVASGQNNRTAVSFDTMFIPTSAGGSGGYLKFRFTDTENVEVCLDNVRVDEIDANPMNPMADLDFPATGPASPVVSPVLPNGRAKKIDNRLFGYTANHWDQTAWPQVGQSVQRLWDDGVHWGILQPNAPGQWDATALARLDSFVNTAYSHGTPVMITLGMSPLWAVDGGCTESTSYAKSCGLPPSPSHIADWKNYIIGLAQRYQGKIKYFELWNEPDVGSIYFGGSGQQLATLAAAAKDALRTADPTNQWGLQLVGPSVTRNGASMLDGFLHAGGANSVDILSIHAGSGTLTELSYYPDYSATEYALPAGIANAKALIYSYGAQAKPLWNTEGQPACLLVSCPPSDAYSRGLLFRSLVTMWSNGIDNFNPYHMEGAVGPWSALATAASNYQTLTPYGEGYKVAANWFKGATMTSAYRMLSPQVYIYQLTNASGVKNYVLWSTSTGPVTLAVPNKPSIFYSTGWNVSKALGLAGETTVLPISREITLQPYSPVMLVP